MLGVVYQNWVGAYERENARNKCDVTIFVCSWSVYGSIAGTSINQVACIFLRILTVLR